MKELSNHRKARFLCHPASPFIIWNIIIPLLYHFGYPAFLPGFAVTIISISLLGLISFMNYRLGQEYPRYASAFYLMIGLNIFSFLLMTSISFFIGLWFMARIFLFQ